MLSSNIFHRWVILTACPDVMDAGATPGVTPKPWLAPPGIALCCLLLLLMSISLRLASNSATVVIFPGTPNPYKSSTNVNIRRIFRESTMFCLRTGFYTFKLMFAYDMNVIPCWVNTIISVVIFPYYHRNRINRTESFHESVVEQVNERIFQLINFPSF